MPMTPGTENEHHFPDTVFRTRWIYYTPNSFKAIKTTNNTTYINKQHNWRSSDQSVDPTRHLLTWTLQFPAPSRTLFYSVPYFGIGKNRYRFAWHTCRKPVPVSGAYVSLAYDGDDGRNDVTWRSRCRKGREGHEYAAAAAADTLPGPSGRRTVRMRAGWRQCRRWCLAPGCRRSNTAVERLTTWSLVVVRTLLE